MNLWVYLFYIHSFINKGNSSTKLLGIANNLLSLNKSSQRVLRSTCNLLVKILSKKERK